MRCTSVSLRGLEPPPAMIEHIAVAFARAPFTPEGRGSHQFLTSMNELKRLNSPAAR